MLPLVSCVQHCDDKVLVKLLIIDLITQIVGLQFLGLMLSAK